MQKISSLIFILGITAGFTYSCSDSEAQATKVVEKGAISDSILSKLEFHTLQTSEYSNPLTVVGEVGFDEDNVVRIFPIVSGSVEEIYFSLGDYVKKGQRIATILSTDISEYQRDFNIAKSNYEVAKKQFDRVSNLYKSNFASERELQIAEMEYKNAELDFKAKKQVLELYGGNSKNSDAVYTIYAPQSGYLVERKVNVGTQIRTDNSESIFTLSDLRSVWILANVYESDIAKVHLGDTVVATTVSYPDMQFSGRVEKINNILDPEARVIKIRTEIANVGEKLLPEMFATVQIIPKETVKALAVPTSAIFLERNQQYVVREIGKGEFEKVRIKVGKTFQSNQYTEVTEGLKDRDKVVSKGALLVSNYLQN